ncbi:hypothetical protein HON52_01610 [Candidatus Uhrbacteria bacterium]|jgi:hypothetical protein|nr:hypothetical protein [Candidatus Uhrbacteria bacterium]
MFGRKKKLLSCDGCGYPLERMGHGENCPVLLREDPNARKQTVDNWIDSIKNGYIGHVIPSDRYEGIISTEDILYRAGGKIEVPLEAFEEAARTSKLDDYIAQLPEALEKLGLDVEVYMKAAVLAHLDVIEEGEITVIVMKELMNAYPAVVRFYDEPKIQKYLKNDLDLDLFKRRDQQLTSEHLNRIRNIFETFPITSELRAEAVSEAMNYLKDLGRYDDGEYNEENWFFANVSKESLMQLLDDILEGEGTE